METTTTLAQAETALRASCLRYPGAYEDHPWGDTVFKVNGKVFVFMGSGAKGFGISAKLPISGAVALMLPFASPTGYGLGKSGWVSATFGAKDDIPLDMLAAWIDESYRAVAPKRMVAQLASAEAGGGNVVASSAAEGVGAKGKRAPAKGKAKPAPAAKAKPAPAAKAKPAPAAKAKPAPAAKVKPAPAAKVKPAPAAKAKSAP